jgi:chitinase
VPPTWKTFLTLVPLLLAAPAYGQGTVPTFRVSVEQATYTIAGRGPAQAGTTIPTLLVPIELSFDGKTSGRPFLLDAAPDVPSILRSPVFARFNFPSGGNSQYIDAMLRTAIPADDSWHTLLGTPEIQPLKLSVPTGSGYVLTSHKSGRSVAIVDVEFLQKEIFRRIPKHEGQLVIAVTRNAAFYALGDATVCCSWGTHGVDSATGNSFVLSTFLRDAPSVVEDADVQPLTQQLAQFFKDPLHDPLINSRGAVAPGNIFPPWIRPAPAATCAGTAVSSTYFLLEPTDTNPKNNFPASKAFLARSDTDTYHLQNAALLSWYTGPSPALGKHYSFPDTSALSGPATPCPNRGGRGGSPQQPTVAATPLTTPPNGHQLIGYWAGYGGAGSTIPMRELSPQWDVIIVAFATPDRTQPEGTMQFRTPAGLDTAQFKSDIAYLKSQGKRVMISLGGGGQHFTLADPKRVPNFVTSVARIVSDYGFDGIDIDFESPSLSIDPGDTDFRHPTTPSIVNLISAIRQLHDRFGPRFLISLVPEGTQVPAGYPSYGGQFGSYLPIAHALRDILTFTDTQSYNTPPLEALDGEIYQPGTVDYHVAMTELVLHGFNVGGDPKLFFPPMPPERVAVGFLTGDTTPAIVSQAMEYLITGKAPAGTAYKLRKSAGYPGMIGAMFWTIDADRRGNHNYSNVIGPQLHGYRQK